MEKIYKNRMTMFDLMKGFAIFIVVLWHTYDYWNLSPQLRFIQIPLNLLWPAMMPIFILACGYWYKPNDNKTYIKRQLKAYMKPYAFVGIMAAGLCAVVNYIRFRSKRAAFGGARGIILAFLTGSSDVVTVKGIMICNLGPTWFIFTLCFAGIILNAIMVSDKLKHKVAAMIALAVIGIALEPVPWLPGCLCGVFEAVLAMYCGYKLKETKYLLIKWEKKDYVKWFALSFIGFLIIVAIMFYFDDNSYVARILPGIPYGMMFLRLGLRLDKKQNKVLDLFRKLGRYSMWIFVIHSIEVLAVDWRALTTKTVFTQMHPFFVLLIFFTVRLLLINIGCIVLGKINDFLIGRTKHGIF